MCNNDERSGNKIKVSSIDLRGMKIHSKLKCGDKLIPVAENIRFHN